MPPEILDEFTNLDVSRQRKYQLRKRKQGKCVICGEPANGYRRHARKETKQPFYCEKHRQAANIRQREYERSRLGCVSRLKEAESYHFG